MLLAVCFELGSRKIAGPRRCRRQSASIAARRDVALESSRVWILLICRFYLHDCSTLQQWQWYVQAEIAVSINVVVSPRQRILSHYYTRHLLY